MKPLYYRRVVEVYREYPSIMIEEQLTRELARALVDAAIREGKIAPVTLPVYPNGFDHRGIARVEIERVVYILTPDEYDTVCKEWKARGQSEVIAESYDLGFAAGRAIGYREGRGLIEMGTQDEPDQD